MNINIYKRLKKFIRNEPRKPYSVKIEKDGFEFGISVRPEKFVNFIKRLYRKYKNWRGVKKMEKQKFKYLTSEVVERIKKYEPIIALAVRKYFGKFKGVNLADLTLWVEAQFIAENRLKMSITKYRVDRTTGKRYKVEAMKPNRAGACGIVQMKQSTFNDIVKRFPEIGTDIWNAETNIKAGVIYDAWLFGRLRAVMPTLDYIQLMDWVFAEYNWRLGLWELFGKTEQLLPIQKCPPETQNYIAKIHEIYSELILLDLPNIILSERN